MPGLGTTRSRHHLISEQIHFPVSETHRFAVSHCRFDCEMRGEYCSRQVDAFGMQTSLRILIGVLQTFVTYRAWRAENRGPAFVMVCSSTSRSTIVDISLEMVDRRQLHLQGA
jgi:hypothetical protein